MSLLEPITKNNRLVKINHLNHKTIKLFKWPEAYKTTRLTQSLNHFSFNGSFTIYLLVFIFTPIATCPVSVGDYVKLCIITEDCKECSSRLRMQKTGIPSGQPCKPYPWATHGFLRHLGVLVILPGSQLTSKRMRFTVDCSIQQQNCFILYMQ